MNESRPAAVSLPCSSHLCHCLISVVLRTVLRLRHPSRARERARRRSSPDRFTTHRPTLSPSRPARSNQAVEMLPAMLAAVCRATPEGEESRKSWQIAGQMLRQAESPSGKALGPVIPALIEASFRNFPKVGPPRWPLAHSEPSTTLPAQRLFLL